MNCQCNTGFVYSILLIFVSRVCIEWSDYRWSRRCWTILNSQNVHQHWVCRWWCSRCYYKHVHHAVANTIASPNSATTLPNLQFTGPLNPKPPNPQNPAHTNVKMVQFKKWVSKFLSGDHWGSRVQAHQMQTTHRNPNRPPGMSSPLQLKRRMVPK
jgi:hypothetical protein